MQQNSGDEKAHGMREEPCKKFVMINDNQGLHIPPLRDRTMTPPIVERTNKEQQFGQVNIVPFIDQYVLNISEVEFYKENHSLDDMDEDDETSKDLIKAFSPSKDQALEDDIPQVSKSQGLSPQRFQHDRFHFKNQDINTVTTGRPNTRLFSFISS